MEFELLKRYNWSMKIAILGFGREGESAYHYWNKPENNITIHDNNINTKLPSGAGSKLGADAFDKLDSLGYDLLVRTPGLRLDLNNIKTPITTVTNEFMVKCPCAVIGVTGTKGKGTTATLIYEILTLAGFNTHLLGNIGVPALDELSSIKSDDLVVYEMSSFQLFDIKKSPHVAVCLMVTEDHLDWHKDLAEYQSAKANIFRFQKASDVAVFFADDEVSSQLALNSASSTKYSYGLSGDVSFSDEKIMAFGQEVINTSEVGLPGPHNLQNICAAIAGVWDYTDDVNIIAQAVKNFKGLPYHIELVANKNGVRYYNDSFSTNPTSAIAAIKSFDAPLVAYFGGYDKNADFTELASVLKHHNIRKIITYGQTGQKIYQALQDGGVASVEHISSSDFEKIILAGISSSQPGDVVLFSPACASMDMFTDYKARGQQFNNIVESL